MKITRLKLWLLSDRGYPEGTVTLPEHAVGNFADLLTRAQALSPGVSMHSVVQAIWTLGSRRVDDNVRHRIPIRGAFATPTRARVRVAGGSSMTPLQSSRAGSSNDRPDKLASVRSAEK